MHIYRKNNNKKDFLTPKVMNIIDSIKKLNKTAKKQNAKQETLDNYSSYFELYIELLDFAILETDTLKMKDAVKIRNRLVKIFC